MKNTLIFLLFGLFLMVSVPFGSCIAATSLFTEILRDFSPVTGRVMDSGPGSVTLNRGSSDGVVTGDLFQVYRKGSPVSDKQGAGVIGYLKRPFALVQVKHAAPHSSRCSVISAGHNIRAGMPVMRYSDMRSVLLTSPGTKMSRSVRQRFYNTLPALEWINPETINSQLDNAAAMKAAGLDLLFYLSTENLKVYGPDHSVIHTYSLSGQALGLSTEGGESHITAVSSSQGEGKAAEVRQQGNFQWENLDTSSGLDLSAARVAGRLYSAAKQVEIADMDGDGRPEAVYLVSRALYVFPFGTGGELLSYEVNGPGNAVGFYLCPERGWIVLNVLVEGVGLRSALIEYRNNTLFIIQDDINLWLSFNDLDGNGTRETLLGQTFDLHTIWGDKVYNLQISSDGIQYLGQLPVPEDFRTGWAQWGDIDGNGRTDLCIFDRAGRAWLFEDGLLRWSTPPGLLVHDEHGDTIMHAVVADISGNGRGEMLFASALPERGDELGARQIVCCIRWENGRFEVKPLTRPVHAWITGISVFDNSLLLAAVPRPEDQDEKPSETVMYRVRLPLGTVME